jgi:hypothetical protein
MRKVVGVFLVTIIGLSLWALTPVAHVTKVPTQKIKREWVKADSLAYARDQIEVFAEKQFACLENLWGKESGWDPTAFNLVKSMGMHAGGIPQLLGMSPKATPSKQIERGLAYINYRYITPCVAWRHEQRKGWY